MNRWFLSCVSVFVFSSSLLSNPFEAGLLELPKMEIDLNSLQYRVMKSALITLVKTPLWLKKAVLNNPIIAQTLFNYSKKHLSLFIQENFLSIALLAGITGIGLPFLIFSLYKQNHQDKR